MEKDLVPIDEKDRPSWELYFMHMALHAATRSSCRYIDAGAVVVAPDNTILSTGYNGVPRGADPNCLKRGCGKDLSGIAQEIKGSGKCDGMHSEWNAILKAKEHGDLTNATLYSLILPCYTCARLTVGAGISRVFYTLEYPEYLSEKERQAGKRTDAELTRDLFARMGVALNHIDLKMDIEKHFKRMQRILKNNFRKSKIVKKK